MNEKNDLNVVIGNRIRYVRESQNKTREQVAEPANISAQFLFEIESGRKSMTARTIINLANALHVSTDYILLGTDASATKISGLLAGLSPECLNLAEEFISIFAVGAKKIDSENRK